MTAAQKTAEAEAASAAEARANAERVETEQRSKLERDAAMRELAADFERKIGHIVEAVAVAASEMQGMSSSMSGKQRRNRATDGGGGRRIDPGLGECRNGGLGDRRTHGLDRQRSPSR